MRRHHPGFPFVALLLIQEIMNRRLFSNIREKKQLTYDANFRCVFLLLPVVCGASRSVAVCRVAVSPLFGSLCVYGASRPVSCHMAGRTRHQPHSRTHCF